jgi:hypothetical protein
MPDGDRRRRVRTLSRAPLGRDVAVVLPWGLLGGLIAICAALATAAAVWPAWSLVRRSPASMVQGRGY